jgi:hypothetical protein
MFHILSKSLSKLKSPTPSKYYQYGILAILSFFLDE